MDCSKGWEKVRVGDSMKRTKHKNYILYNANCLKAMRRIPANYVDSCVCDPPYGLSKEPNIQEVMRHWLKGTHYQHNSAGFMGKSWDSFVPGPLYWIEVFRVLKPGAHCLVFAGTRTYDLMTIALRFAGFEIRDCIRFLQDDHYPAWVHGQGFPKSMDISKGIDKKLGKKRKVIGIKPGHEEFVNRKTKGHRDFSRGALKGFDRPWMHDDEKAEAFHYETAPNSKEAQAMHGWGSALKPAWEPIIVARKPLEGTLVDNALAHGTGGLNIADSRIKYTKTNPPIPQIAKNQRSVQSKKTMYDGQSLNKSTTKAVIGGSTAGRYPSNVVHDGSDSVLQNFAKKERFFFCAKPSTRERNAATSNTHPTVKPIELMRYLVKLVTPKNGICLDPFMGSGTTGIACLEGGFRFIGIEKEAEYFDIARQRIKHANSNKLQRLW